MNRSTFEPESLAVFLLTVFALFLVHRLQEALKGLFDVYVFFGRGLAHKHQVIIFCELFYLLDGDLPGTRVLIGEIHFVGHQRNLAGLFAIFSELWQPMIEALKAITVSQVKYQQSTHSLSVVADHYRPIALTPTRIPNLGWYADHPVCILLHNLQGFGLKLYPNSRDLPRKDASIIPLEYIWLAYTNVTGEYDWKATELGNELFGNWLH